MVRRKAVSLQASCDDRLLNVAQAKRRNGFAAAGLIFAPAVGKHPHAKLRKQNRATPIGGALFV